MVRMPKQGLIFSVSCVVVCLLLVSGTSLCAQPAYKVLRYEEDYRYLKDPSPSTDFWDPIKYLPLGDQEDWYPRGDTTRQGHRLRHDLVCLQILRACGGQEAVGTSTVPFACAEGAVEETLHRSWACPAPSVHRVRPPIATRP